MSVIKKPNGRFQVSVYNEYGERIRKTFKLQSEARAFESKINDGKYNTKLENNGLIPARVCMDDALREFLLLKRDLRPKSYVKYKGIVGQFSIFVKNCEIEYLHEFNNNHATKFFSELVKERTTEQGEIVEPSSETVNFYIQTIRAFFNLEMQKRRIKGNPFDGVNYLRVERQIRDYYTETELRSFFAQEMDSQMRNIFTVFLHAGLRYGELANLKVSSIDLKNNIMSIRSSGDFQTKTFKSQRDIPLNETLIKLFTEILKNRNPEEYVFTTKHNNRVSQKELLRYCKAIGEKAGIKNRIYLHKFRHTFATQLSLKGCRVEAINKLLGHANIQDTMIYTHLESGRLHKEIRILDGIASDKTKDKGK